MFLRQRNFDSSPFGKKLRLEQVYMELFLFLHRHEVVGADARKFGGLGLFQFDFLLGGRNLEAFGLQVQVLLEVT